MVRVDKKKIHEAIVAAEASSGSQIFVSFAPYFWGSVRRTAEKALRKHARKHGAQRYAVLFFIVPSRREFALVGNAEAHAKLGQKTWNAVAELVQTHLRDGDLTAALVHGIQTIGEALAAHRPCDVT